MRCATSEPRCAALGACLLALLAARPASAEVVRLSELEQGAVRSRPSLQAESARVAIANAQIAIAAAPLYPTLSAVANVDALPGSWLVNVRDVDGQRYVVQGARTIGESGAFTPQTRYGASLLLTSRVYDFGRTRFMIRAAEASEAAAQHSARAEKLQVVSQVRAAYLAWLSAHESRRILAANAQEAEKLRQILEARIAEGTRPGSELALARYDEAQANLMLEQSEVELAGAKAELEQATARKLSDQAEPDPALLEQLPVATDSGEQAKLSALEANRSAALANARAQRYARAPVLSANVEGGVRGQTTQLFPQYRFGLLLSMPLLDGGLSRASAALADARAAELAAMAREARGHVEAERARADAELELTERRLVFARNMLAAAKDELEHSLGQLDLGVSQAESVVQARRRVAQAELEVLSARIALARARLRLPSAALSGSGT